MDSQTGPYHPWGMLTSFFIRTARKRSSRPSLRCSRMLASFFIRTARNATNGWRGTSGALLTALALLSLGCGASEEPAVSTWGTTPSGDCAGISVTGSYSGNQLSSNGSTYSGQPVNLTQSGSSVDGWDLGTSGAVETLSGTLQGCVFTGRWSQAASGPFAITFSSDGTTFHGQWNYDGGSVSDGSGYSWTGLRTGSTPDPKPTTSSNGCSGDSDCGSCQRCELSTGNCLARLVCP